MIKGLVLGAIVEEVDVKEKVSFITVRTSKAFYNLTYFGNASDIEADEFYVFVLKTPNVRNGFVSYVVSEYSKVEGE